jgi:hypothetical protein
MAAARRASTRWQRAAATTPKEIAMNHIRAQPCLRHCTGALAGLAAPLLAAAATAPAALSSVPDPVSHVHNSRAPTPTIIVGGMPGWQISLIAIGTAALAATAAVLLDRARQGQRGVVVSAA